MKIYSAKKIYSVNESFTHFNAMAIEGEEIVELDDLSCLMAKYPAAEVITEYENDFIYPGFVEPHLHILGSASMFAALIPVSFTDWTINGRTYKAVRTPEAFVSTMKERVKEFSDRETLVLWGHYEPLHGELTREILDEIDSTRPFAMWGASIHKLILNSKAVEDFKVKDIPDSVWGVIKDVEGHPTGVLIEQAMFKTAVEHIVSKVTPQDMLHSLQSVLEQGRSKGVTTCVDMGIGISMPYEMELKLLEAADAIPTMPKCRKGYMFGWQKVYEGQDLDAQKTFDFVDQHYKSNKEHSTLFPVKCIKFFADGAVSDYEIITKDAFQDNRVTGWLHRFADRTEDTLAEDMSKFWDNDYSIAIHTQGDQAQSKVLDAVDTLSENGKGRDGQMFIQHMGFTDDEFFERVAKMKYKPCASVTPYYSYHFYSSWQKEQILPKSCFKQLQRAQSALDVGMSISLNADIPLMPTNPMMGAYILMTRLDIDGNIVLAEEAISRQDALKAITKVAAEQHGLNKIGTLEKGKLADFTVLEFDWMQDDLAKLTALDAKACYVGGEKA